MRWTLSSQATCPWQRLHHREMAKSIQSGRSHFIYHQNRICISLAGDCAMWGLGPFGCGHLHGVACVANHRAATTAICRIPTRSQTHSAREQAAAAEAWLRRDPLCIRFTYKWPEMDGRRTIFSFTQIMYVSLVSSLAYANIPTKHIV